MDEADMKLAFQRHATSKIREFQDMPEVSGFCLFTDLQQDYKGLWTRK